MAEFDQTATIGNFLAAAAARQPTPGGGAVAALAGALAASMGEMAVQYSISKKNPRPGDSEFLAAVSEFQRARQLLVTLMSEDQAAYEALTAAKKLPESPQKKEAVVAALSACVATPQAVAAAAKAVLELAQSLTPRVNPYLLSDLAVCAELAMATVRCAIYNVQVNLPELADDEKRRGLEAANGQMLSGATAAIQKTIPAIWDRLSRQESKP